MIVDYRQSQIIYYFDSDYTPKINVSGGWINAHVDGNKIIINIAANNSGGDREGSITLSVNEPNCQINEKIPIFQKYGEDDEVIGTEEIYVPSSIVDTIGENEYKYLLICRKNTYRIYKSGKKELIDSEEITKELLFGDNEYVKTGTDPIPYTITRLKGVEEQFNLKLTCNNSDAKVKVNGATHSFIYNGSFTEDSIVKTELILPEIDPEITHIGLGVKDEKMLKLEFDHIEESFLVELSALTIIGEHLEYSSDVMSKNFYMDEDKEYEYKINETKIGSTSSKTIPELIFESSEHIEIIDLGNGKLRFLLKSKKGIEGEITEYFTISAEGFELVTIEAYIPEYNFRDVKKLSDLQFHVEYTEIECEGGKAEPIITYENLHILYKDGEEIDITDGIEEYVTQKAFKISEINPIYYSSLDNTTGEVFAKKNLTEDIVEICYITPVFKVFNNREEFISETIPVILVPCEVPPEIIDERYFIDPEEVHITDVWFNIDFIDVKFTGFTEVTYSDGTKEIVDEEVFNESMYIGYNETDKVKVLEDLITKKYYKVEEDLKLHCHLFVSQNPEEIIDIPCDLSVEPNNVVFTTDGGEETIQVTSLVNEEYAAWEVVDDKYYVIEIIDDNSFKIICKKNTTFDESHERTIYLYNKVCYTQVTVSQEYNETPEDSYSIDAVPSPLYFEYKEGDTNSIVIYSLNRHNRNVPWEYEYNGEHFIITKIISPNTMVIKTKEENDTTKEYEDEIRFYNVSAETTVKLIQKTKSDSPEPEPEGNYSLIVYSNMEGNVLITTESGEQTEYYLNKNENNEYVTSEVFFNEKTTISLNRDIPDSKSEICIEGLTNNIIEVEYNDDEEKVFILTTKYTEYDVFPSTITVNKPKQNEHIDVSITEKFDGLSYELINDEFGAFNISIESNVLKIKTPTATKDEQTCIIQIKNIDDFDVEPLELIIKKKGNTESEESTGSTSQNEYIFNAIGINSSNSIEFESVGGVKTFTIQSTLDGNDIGWSVINNIDYYEITTKNNTITIKCDENTSTTSSHSRVLTLKQNGSNKEITINVSQKVKEESTPGGGEESTENEYVFETTNLTSNSLIFDSTGGTKEIVVRSKYGTSDVVWSFSSNDSNNYYAISKEENKIIIRCNKNENDSSHERKLTLLQNVSNKKIEINISQQKTESTTPEGGEEGTENEYIFTLIETNSNNITFDVTGGSQSFTINSKFGSSDVDWSFNSNDESNYYTFKKDGNKMTITCSENTSTTSSHSRVLTLKQNGSNKEITINVSQKVKEESTPGGGEETPSTPDITLDTSNQISIYPYTPSKTIEIFDSETFYVKTTNTTDSLKINSMNYFNVPSTISVNTPFTVSCKNDYNYTGSIIREKMVVSVGTEKESIILLKTPMQYNLYIDVQFVNGITSSSPIQIFVNDGTNNLAFMESISSANNSDSLVVSNGQLIIKNHYVGFYVGAIARNSSTTQLKVTAKKGSSNLVLSSSANGTYSSELKININNTIYNNTFIGSCYTIYLKQN